MGGANINQNKHELRLGMIFFICFLSTAGGFRCVGTLVKLRHQAFEHRT